MPVQLTSFLIPKNNAPFYLMDDIYVRGSIKACVDLAARDALPVSGMKEGSLCYVAANKTFYEWINAAWSRANIGEPGPAGTWTFNNQFPTADDFPPATGLAGTPAVAQDSGLIYISNGTDWVLIPNGAPQIPYDVALNAFGKPNTAGDLIAAFVAPRPLVLETGVTAGMAYLGVVPTSGMNLPLKYNGTQIGVVSYNAGDHQGTVNVTNATTMTAGGRLELFNHSSVDVTAEDFMVTIKGHI